MLWAYPAKLRAHAPDALSHGEPGRRRQRPDRPDERPPGREDEPDGDDDHALGAASDADVAAQPERLRARTGVADEERAGDGGEGEADADEVAVARKDERNRAEDDAFADAVGGRVEEGAEGRPLPARPRERAVEDVEDRADEEHENGRGDAESDPRRGERVRRDASAREPEHGATGDPASALRVAALQAGGPAQGGPQASLGKSRRNRWLCRRTSARSATAIPPTTSSQKWFAVAMTQNQTQSGHTAHNRRSHLRRVTV